MDDNEMVSILEEIARSGKSNMARIDALKELRAIRERTAAAPEQEKPVETGDEFDGLYAVENPGRTRQAS